MALQIARISQTKPDVIDLTQDGYLLEVVARRWGQTTIAARVPSLPASGPADPDAGP